MREKLDPVFVFIIVYTILSFVYLELKRGVAAMPSKGGLAIAVPYPTVIYRGWIGGIVSIDKNHQSRFRIKYEALYNIIVVILQLIPYTLAAGAGVNLGISYFKSKEYYTGRKWMGYSVEAIKDCGRIYLLVIPLFLIASLFEFLF